MKVIRDGFNARAVQVGVFSSVLVFGLASGPLSAQQSPDTKQQQQSSQSAAQPSQEQQTAAAAGPNVTVREQQPQVEVQQPAPQVSVKQPPPQVQVQQPQPQVQVEQSQQPPQVTVQREGQPQVQVEQPQGQEQVGTAPAKPGEQQQQTSQQTQTQTQPTDVAQLQQMKGKSLYSQSGEELGKIDELARDKTTGKTVAIVSTGGFLGVGGEKVAMPVENIQIEGDRAVTASVTSKEELKQMATAGTEQYEKLDEGQSQRG